MSQQFIFTSQATATITFFPALCWRKNTCTCSSPTGPGERQNGYHRCTFINCGAWQAPQDVAEQQTYLKIRFLYTKTRRSPNERAEESINHLHFYMEPFYELVHNTAQPGREHICLRVLLQIIKINGLIKLWSLTFSHIHSQSCKLLG